ncbi:MAG: dephospho-CoA kinase [Naasia sp.]|jgi:dephospho-CoA kinase|uniref:dephospho-CoA kinase n=1 Tax=Naasia sp. TaxID=2546198 RepID=UPI0026275B1C|nr:dephospho-CoA kinase [Naasia sp.]MCU1569840.1 dephospho-CoA kinase [Naasia sp.]
MTLIALTGGIAAGKSTVAGRLAELGAVVVDADRLAREAVAVGSPGLAALARAFGDRVLTASGELDRAALGAIVFADGDARAQVNAIVHPEVARLSRARFAEALATDPDALVVYDVPLLAESRGAAEFDRIVVVQAPVEERIRRMMTARGMTRAEAEGRVLAQATDEERAAIADEVIDAGGSLEQTMSAADALYDRLKA